MQWSLLLLICQCSAVGCQLYEYHYINVNKTWTEAQQYCRENHTDLATVSNMTDMERLLSNSSGDMKEAWIGLYDQKGGNRTWRWSLPGVEFNTSYQPWKPGQPNDYKELQNCGFMWDNQQWGDLSCNDLEFSSAIMIIFCRESIKTGRCSHLVYYTDRNSSKKFHLIQEKKNWTEAQSYCRKEHTDLISGQTQLQDEKVKRECSSVGNGTYILIGLFRDTWRWSDGSSFSFRNWNLQFDYQIINSGQCAMTVIGDEGRWRNENCAVRKPFICYDDKLILIKEMMSWKDALSYCRNHYHSLVTITNLEEQRWVQEKAKNSLTPFVWLGLRYNGTGVWFWVCKESSLRNTSQASERWMNDYHISGAMDAGGQHRWFQRNDTEELNFICSEV